MRDAHTHGREPHGYDRRGRGRSLGIAGRARLVVVAAIAGALGVGCTVVRIEHGADVRTQLLPGIAKVDVSDLRSGVAAVSTSGIGLVLGPRSAALGWMTERVVAVPADGACKLVFVDSRPEELRSDLALLHDAGLDPGSICSLNTKGSKE